MMSFLLKKQYLFRHQSSN